MQISNRLAVAIVLSACVAIATGLLTTIAVRISMKHAYSQHERLLTSELESRRLRMENYLTDIANDLDIIASSRFAQEALIDITKAFHAIGDDATSRLQQLYILDNPNPPGRKQLLLSAGDGSDYSKLHETYHDWTRKITQMHNYHDIFLVDTDGDVVYTVAKEDDFASNLNTGKYSDTELGKIYHDIAKNPEPNKIYGKDFIIYAPSGGKPAGFIGTAVRKDNVFIGAVIIQIKADPFNEIMHWSKLFGDSGETFIAGSDHLLRTRSRFLKEPAILKKRIDTPAVTEALAGRSGIIKTTDYRGIDVLAAYAPIVGKYTTWAMIAKIDIDEVEKQSHRMMRWLIMISIIATILAFMIGWQLADHNDRAGSA